MCKLIYLFSYLFIYLFIYLLIYVYSIYSWQYIKTHDLKVQLNCIAAQIGS